MRSRGLRMKEDVKHDPFGKMSIMNEYRKMAPVDVGGLARAVGLIVREALSGVHAGIGRMAPGRVNSAQIDEATMPREFAHGRAMTPCRSLIPAGTPRDPVRRGCASRRPPE